MLEHPAVDISCWYSGWQFFFMPHILTAQRVHRATAVAERKVWEAHPIGTHGGIAPFIQPIRRSITHEQHHQHQHAAVAAAAALSCWPRCGIRPLIPTHTSHLAGGPARPGRMARRYPPHHSRMGKAPFCCSAVGSRHSLPHIWDWLAQCKLPTLLPRHILVMTRHSNVM